MQYSFDKSFNGRMRDECLNETLFIGLAHPPVEIAVWVEDYNPETPCSALGYFKRAAFASEPDKQWSSSLSPTCSAIQPIAPTGPTPKTTARL